MEQDFIEPSKSSRKKLLMLVIGAALIGGLLQFVLMPQYFAFVKALPPCDQFPWLRGALAVVIFSVPAIAIFWAIPHARKLLKYEQIPLPGAWVWRRTPIKRGASVRWMAYGLFAWALLAVIFPFWAWTQLDFLLTPPKQCLSKADAENKPYQISRVLR